MGIRTCGAVVTNNKILVRARCYQDRVTKPWHARATSYSKNRTFLSHHTAVVVHLLRVTLWERDQAVPEKQESRVTLDVVTTLDRAPWRQ